MKKCNKCKGTGTNHEECPYPSCLDKHCGRGIKMDNGLCVHACRFCRGQGIRGMAFYVEEKNEKQRLMSLIEINKLCIENDIGIGDIIWAIQYSEKGAKFEGKPIRLRFY
jgi:hypothetical protein